MKPFITRLLCTILGATALAAASSGYALDSWPSKTITFIVPFPPGGTTDLLGRAIAQSVSKSLKTPVIVDNRPGANGAIGSAYAAGTAPDGYTFLVTGIGSNAISHGLNPKLKYDSGRDFVHITQFVAGPNVLVANVNAPFKTLQEFIAYAKENPGKLNYASAGAGASGHLAMEYLKQATGIDLLHVPYKGGAPALQDVVGGQLPVMFLNQDVVYPFVKSGKLRALAVSDLKRNPLYPDTPTLHESGVKDFSAVSWVGLAAPKGLPAPIVSRMNEEVVKALAEPELKSRLEGQGFVVVGSTPQQAGDFVRSEIARWSKVVKTANIHAD